MARVLVRVSTALAIFTLGVFLMTTIARAQDGASLYRSKCAMCHGAGGKGDTAVGKSMKLRDLGSAEVQKQTDAQLIEITTNGKGKMPAYKGKLTDDQIKQVVAYIRTFKT